MHPPSIDRVTSRQDKGAVRRPAGFSLLEMMMVVTVILIIASIATRFYRTTVLRAREAVLADHLIEAVSSQQSVFSDRAEG